MIIKITELQQITGVGFGTSGIRDTNEKLSDKTIYIYTSAFLKYVKDKIGLEKKMVALAGDRRPSTNRIIKAVATAIKDCGFGVINCGMVPTAAVTLYGMKHQMVSIMVTGSHIPSDRNGVKYNLATGEILKADEKAMAEMEVEVDENIFNDDGSIGRLIELEEVDDGARNLYKERFLNFFDNDLLHDKKIGVYGHSAVGREIMVELMNEFGAETVELGFAADDEFVAVDTDAVDEKLVQLLKNWSQEFGLNYIISTDGDGDRPLMTDENGDQIRSELLPVIAGKYLGIEAMACTLTVSTAVDKSNLYKKIVKTKVGSPMVIEGMQQLIDQGFEKVGGYELNGGFLTGSVLEKNGKKLEPLPTRDAILPILAVMAMAKESNKSVAQLVDELPKRLTYSLSIKGIPTEKSLNVLENWNILKGEIEANFGTIKTVDELDGLRLTVDNGNIIHFRPSRNSPEFRCYTEADSFDEAKELSEKAIELIRKWTNN